MSNRPQPPPKPAAKFPLTFRCWHSIEEKIYDVVEIHNGVPSMIRDRRTGGYSVVSSAQAQFVQSIMGTGLVDSTGVPIFELDRLNYREEYRNGQTGTVVWGDGMFLVQHEVPNAEGSYLDALAMVYRVVKIVGHHFEYAKRAEED